MPFAIINQLKGVLAGRHDIDIGQLQLINLDLVKTGAGERWDKLRHKVFDASTHFIEKRIDPDDVLIRCEDGFMLLFADDDPAASERKTKEISDALNLFFLGDEILKKLQIKSLSRRLDLDNLATLLQAEGVANSEATRQAAGPATPQKPARPKAMKLQRIDFRSDSEAVFVPVWDSRKQAVTTQFCTLKTHEHATGDLLYGRAALHGHDEPRDHAAFDLAVCDAASRAMRDAADAGRRIAICVQVHLKTLSTRDTRQRYFAALGEVPPPLRDFTFVRVDGIETGTPQCAIQDAFQSLRPHAGYLLAKLPFGHTDLTAFEGLGIALFGWDSPPAARDFRFDARQTAALGQFSKQAVRMGASAYLSRPPSWPAISQALDAGVRFLVGPRIAPATKRPLIPFRLETSDIRRRSDALVLT
ncbi:hypothetical protein [Hyphobacterium marinum]|uniref:EAL domain-containing protein n=1 Tax=Hyphobacterium marinum TaxID=3116574 RepID=A0ABU7M2X8_9PROT|nr:hypothetical protein [Hyphobacterium sp. Y6023]MEE2567615.1 hypothetical protein [Hyphobacterium sp. Y6023]